MENLNPRWVAYKSLDIPQSTNADYMVFISTMKSLYLNSIGETITSAIHGHISNHEQFTKFIQKYAEDQLNNTDTPEKEFIEFLQSPVDVVSELS